MKNANEIFYPNWKIKYCKTCKNGTCLWQNAILNGKIP